MYFSLFEIWEGVHRCYVGLGFVCFFVGRDIDIYLFSLAENLCCGFYDHCSSPIDKKGCSFGHREGRKWWWAAWRVGLLLSPWGRGTKKKWVFKVIFCRTGKKPDFTKAT